MKEIKSPCVNVCKYNSDKICISCYRDIDEITNWIKYSNDEKLKVLDNIQKRRIDIGQDYYGF